MKIKYIILGLFILLLGYFAIRSGISPGVVLVGILLMVIGILASKLRGKRHRTL